MRGNPEMAKETANGDTITVAEWKDRPHTHVRKRHIVVEHRVVLRLYDDNVVDVEHQVRSDAKSATVGYEWETTEVYEVRSHGVEHHTLPDLGNDKA